MVKKVYCISKELVVVLSLCVNYSLYVKYYSTKDHKVRYCSIAQSYLR